MNPENKNQTKEEIMEEMEKTKENMEKLEGELDTMNVSSIEVSSNGSAADAPKDEKEELKDLLLRTQADFENYRKQTERRVEDIRKMASKHVLVQLLSVVDHIELALKSAATMESKLGLFEGVELIYSELQMLLVNNGLVEIEVEGKKFDPYFHEALMKVNSSEPENTIVEVYQKGYILHGQVIRHAKVKISNGKLGEFEKSEQEKSGKKK